MDQLEETEEGLDVWVVDKVKFGEDSKSFNISFFWVI